MEDTQLQWTDTDRLPAEAETEQTTPPVTSEMSIAPPPGFPQFQWPQADWILEGDPSADPGLKFVTSWFTRIIKERASDVPLLPLSPITAEGSQDSIMVQVGLYQTRSTHREDFLFKNILRAPAMGYPRQPTEIQTGRGFHGGAWPERDRSYMNVRRPHLGSWEPAVSFVRQHISRRTTLLLRAD